MKKKTYPALGRFLSDTPRWLKMVEPTFNQLKYDACYMCGMSPKEIKKLHKELTDIFDYYNYKDKLEI